MFTGIIREKAKVKEVKLQEKGGLLLSISKPKWKVKLGDSISINGVCSTVKKIGTTTVFEYMPETIEKTNVSSLKKGDEVNLEVSLRLADRLDGHMVLGHVDTTGEIVSIVEEGNSWIFEVKVKGANPVRTDGRKQPASNGMKFLAPKGSVTLEGISLTVVDVTEESFTVKIIPYTLEHTNLHQKKVGDILNIEFDVIAKYLARLIGKVD